MTATATRGRLGLTLAVALALATTGCAPAKPLPEYTEAVSETNAAMRQIADLLPLTTEESHRAGSPFTCGNMLGPADADTPVFFTGNLTLYQPASFDLEEFIARLPEKLPGTYEARPPRAELDNGTSLHIRTRDGTGPSMSVYADDIEGRKSVYIVGMSRCAKPEPPEVASAPLPDYETVRDEATALSAQVEALIPEPSRTERSNGWEDDCEEMVDPFTGIPPVRHTSVVDVDVPHDFDGEAFIAQLPELLGENFEVAPPGIPDGNPTVRFTAHDHGGASIKVTASTGISEVMIVVYSRCARGELPGTRWTY